MNNEPQIGREIIGDVSGAKKELWRKEGNMQPAEWTRFVGQESQGIVAEGHRIVPLVGTSLRERKKSLLNMIGWTGGQEEALYTSPTNKPADKIESAKQSSAVLVNIAQVRTEVGMKVGDLFPGKNIHTLKDGSTFIDDVTLPQDMKAVYQVMIREPLRPEMMQWMMDAFYPVMIRGMAGPFQKKDFSSLMDPLVNLPGVEKTGMRIAVSDMLSDPAFKAMENPFESLVTIIRTVNDKFLLPYNAQISYRDTQGSDTDCLSVYELMSNASYPFDGGGVRVLEVEQKYPQKCEYKFSYERMRHGILTSRSGIDCEINRFMYLQEKNKGSGLVGPFEEHHIQHQKPGIDMKRAIYFRILAEELRHAMDAVRSDNAGKYKMDAHVSIRELMKAEGQLYKETFKDIQLDTMQQVIEVSGHMTAASIDPIVVAEWMEKILQPEEPGPYWMVARIGMALLMRENGMYDGDLYPDTMRRLPAEQFLEGFHAVYSLNPHAFRLLLNKAYEAEFKSPLDELPFPAIDENGASHKRIHWPYPEDPYQ